MTAEIAIDADRILAEARALSYPRYPGTEGDRRAIARVAEALEAAGLEVAVEEFSYDVRPAFRALKAMLAGSAALLAAAGFLVDAAPGWAAAAVALALAAGGVFLAWTPGLERIYHAAGPTVTANVVGRRRAARPRLTLILLAHHDSKSQNLTLPVRVGLTLVALAGALGLAVLVALRLAGASAGPGWLPEAAGLAAAAALLGLATLESGNRSPGATDNAGSVGILLELARKLPAAVPEGVELIFLSPGAEEDHMVGAMRFLDRHLEELRPRPLLAINFDGAGLPGRPVLIERYGFGRPFSPTLSTAARRAAARLGLRVRGVLIPPALGVDAIPFAHRGVECLTFASGGLSKAVLAVHSKNDRPENLSRGALDRVARLAAEVVLDVTAPAFADSGCSPRG